MEFAQAVFSHVQSKFFSKKLLKIWVHAIRKEIQHCLVVSRALALGVPWRTYTTGLLQEVCLELELQTTHSNTSQRSVCLFLARLPLALSSLSQRACPWLGCCSLRAPHLDSRQCLSLAGLSLAQQSRSQSLEPWHN